MSLRPEGGFFGFDTPHRATSNDDAYHQFRHSPVVTAVTLFERSVEQDFFLQEFAANKATHALDHVLTAFHEKGSGVWRTTLNSGNDVLRNSYQEGFELARLFLVTPHISYNTALQQYYEEHRLKVIETLVKHFSNFTSSQIQEVYEQLRLHPTRYGSFQETVVLRRKEVVLH